MQMSQAMPSLASTACINRRFEECSVQELETEMKMFAHELQNALWHKPMYGAAANNSLIFQGANGPLLGGGFASGQQQLLDGMGNAAGNGAQGANGGGAGQ